MKQNKEDVHCSRQRKNEQVREYSKFLEIKDGKKDSDEYRDVW